MFCPMLRSTASLHTGPQLRTALGWSRTRAWKLSSAPSLRRRCMHHCTAGLQKPLSNAEKKAKRAESQRMGKALPTINLGKAGVTQKFLQGLLDAMAANELVKVRVGGNCDGDMKTIAESLEQAADCVVVHSIGFTLTLYRDKSLPRVSAAAAAAALGLSTQQAEQVQQQQEAPAAAAAAPAAGREQGELGAGSDGDEQWEEDEGEEEEDGSDSDEDLDPSSEEVDVVIGGVKRRIQKPPEFTIIQ